MDSIDLYLANKIEEAVKDINQSQQEDYEKRLKESRDKKSKDTPQKPKDLKLGGVTLFIQLEMFNEKKIGNDIPLSHLMKISDVGSKNQSITWKIIPQQRPGRQS